MLPASNSKGQTTAPQPFPEIPKIKIEHPVFDGFSKLAIASMENTYSAEYEYMEKQFLLDKKADELRDAYVSNMLTAQQKLNPLLGKNGYRAAVRRELPGAPVGMHCMYGQYTHLSRALAEKGDTLTIIPPSASRACIAFKSEMRKKYSGVEYDGCIFEGKMYESDSLYNAALVKYLKQKKITENTPDSVRWAAIAEFDKRNFSADRLESGAILIVPRYRGSKTKFHAIMDLGRGRIENGTFVADTSGRHIYTGHNRETMGDMFKTYDTSNVFAVDTRKIARVEYAKELNRIENMSRQDLLVFLKDAGKDLTPYEQQSLSREILVKMARAMYFHQDKQIAAPKDNLVIAQNMRNKLISDSIQNIM